MKLQALRGAITCDEDSKAEIDAKTTLLVKELFARNGLTNDDVVSILFTATPDLHAQFPAASARASLGLDDVPLIGAQEQDVPDALVRCVRVMIHCYSERPRAELHHVFLGDAAVLRPDLQQ
ncbi:MAG: chorismate mutase [Acidimicrobiia bacterium]